MLSSKTLGASMGLAAGYGIHSSVPQEETTSRQTAWPCDGKQAATCRSTWCPAGPLSSTISRQGQTCGSPVEIEGQLASNNKRRRTVQMSSPAQSLQTNAYVGDLDMPQQMPSKPSTGPPLTGVAPSTSSMDPAELLSLLPTDASPESDDILEKETQEAKAAEETKNQPPKTSRPTRLPHSIIERRYRDNLNRQLDTLRSKLPNFKDSYACSAEIEDSGLPAKWPSKAVIIAAAIKYIEQMEAERDRARAHATVLQQQVDGLQKLVRCDDCSILNYLQSLQIQPNATGS